MQKIIGEGISCLWDRRKTSNDRRKRVQFAQTNLVPNSKYAKQVLQFQVWINSLIQDAAKEKHRQHVKSVIIQQPSITKYAVGIYTIKQSRCSALSKIEVGILAEHDPPRNISKKLLDLFKSMFPDSKFTQQFT